MVEVDVADLVAVVVAVMVAVVVAVVVLVAVVVVVVVCQPFFGLGWRFPFFIFFGLFFFVPSSAVSSQTNRKCSKNSI